MRRATGILNDRSRSWVDITDVWDETDYTLEFWDLTSGHSIRDFGANHPGEATEIESIACYTLVEFARDWCAGEVVEASAVQDRRLFWHMLKKRISWRVHEHLAEQRAALSIDVSPEDDPEMWSNQLIARISNHSATNVTLVRAMMTLRPGMRALLALSFYEQLPSDEVYRLMGTGDRAAKSKRAACEQILDTAINATATHRHEPARHIDHFAKWTPPAELTAWLQTTYGIGDVAAYLDYVAAMWAIDASYMVDVIWFAHGVFSISPTARKKIELDSDAARELKEARYAAGMTQGEAARALAAAGHRIDQKRLSLFERMQPKAAIKPEVIDALRALYAAAEPTGRRGGGRAPRRFASSY